MVLILALETRRASQITLQVRSKSERAVTRNHAKHCLAIILHRNGDHYSKLIRFYDEDRGLQTSYQIGWMGGNIVKNCKTFLASHG